MGDLMSATYTFDELHRKYKNFLTPAAKIKVDGNDLAGQMHLAVEELTVDLVMEGAASVSFTVANAYDLKRRQFDSNVKAKLIPGALVEVWLGYVSALTCVFKGYISEVSAAFRDIPSISVTAMDARRLMMDSGETYCIHPVKSYSAAFSEVIKRYAKLLPRTEVENTPDQFEKISQRNNDYQFITMYLAQNAGKEFFVLAGKAYFRTRAKVKSPIVTLEWGRDLLSFTRNSMYQNFQVKILGYDEENKKTVEGEAVEKNPEPQKTVIPEMQETIRPDPAIRDLESAKKKAKKEAVDRKRKAQGGSGTCIGLPEIVPGRYIKLAHLDSSLDKSYYLKSVKHTFGTDGFTTSFEVGGWD